MTYKVKNKPKIIYEAVTYEFTLEDETGKEYQIRKVEDSNSGEYYIFQDNVWVDYKPDEEMEDFIDYDVEF